MSQQTQDRRWVVNLLADEYGEPMHRQFDEDVQVAMAESASILLRLGGSIRSYVIRAEDPETGLWYPTQAVFAWQSFVPGIRAQRPRPVAQPAPEPDVDLEPEPDLSDAIGELEPDAGFDVLGERETFGAAEPEEGGQLFEKGDEQRVAATAAETQELLRDGWKPVARV